MPTKPQGKHIIVLGAGPAGAVTAIGLQKLGFKVTVISTIRQHNVVEGISDRVYRALQNVKLNHAIATISAPISRYAHWNGVENAANRERLITRNVFDKALIDDLTDANINVIHQQIVKVQYQDHQGWRVTCKNHQHYHGDFVVEARGRAASLTTFNNTPKKPVKGEHTLTFSQNWQTACKLEHQGKSSFTYAKSLKQGWLWLACIRDQGNQTQQVFSQISINRKSELAQDKNKIIHFLKQQLLQITHPDQTMLALPKVTTSGDSFTRISTPILNNDLIGEHYLRIGDAAMAVDPLSGNGIFQSLSSALSAPAVINTIINKPENSTLAKQFYQQRIEHLFYRFCRIGRDFYQQEQQWPQENFWRNRSQWPDNQPAHSNEADKVIGTEIRPVLNDAFIEPQRVLITKNQPLGIWKIDGKNAVEVWRNRE